MKEHEAAAHGTVLEVGQYTSEERAHRLMNKVAKAIERHGEVHATFDEVDGEVELRLGTVRLDYDAETFDVWDGDFYIPFSADKLVSYYRPTDIYHR